MEYYYCPDLEAGQLTVEESKHCLQVRRSSVGDQIHLLNGRGTYALARIKSVAKQIVHFDIENSCRFDAPTPCTLAVAPVKNTERLEWMVEKCTELGVTHFAFVNTRHTERKTLNMQRLEKIAIAALKQSGRYYLPTLAPLTPLHQYLAHEQASEKYVGLIPHDSYRPIELQHTQATAILIGPEGDFDSKEVDDILLAGFKPLALGTFRLRTETAAMAAVAKLLT